MNGLNLPGNYYGTFKEAVLKEVQSGRDVILEIEVQGAMQVKEKLPEAILIFIAPPSREELFSRLKGRATEDPETIQRRLSIAEKELNMQDRFDYVVVNDDLQQTIQRFEALILTLRRASHG